MATSDDSVSKEEDHGEEDHGKEDHSEEERDQSDEEDNQDDGEDDEGDQKLDEGKDSVDTEQVEQEKVTVEKLPVNSSPSTDNEQQATPDDAETTNTTSEAYVFFEKVAKDNELKLGKTERDFMQSLLENEVKLKHLENMSYEHWRETNMNIFMRAALQTALLEHTNIQMFNIK